MYVVPGPRPTGALRASKSAPGRFVDHSAKSLRAPALSRH